MATEEKKEKTIGAPAPAPRIRDISSEFGALIVDGSKSKSANQPSVSSANGNQPKTYEYLTSKQLERKDKEDLKKMVLKHQEEKKVLESENASLLSVIADLEAELAAKTTSAAIQTPDVSHGFGSFFVDTITRMKGSPRGENEVSPGELGVGASAKVYRAKNWIDGVEYAAKMLLSSAKTSDELEKKRDFIKEELDKHITLTNNCEYILGYSSVLELVEYSPAGDESPTVGNDDSVEDAASDDAGLSADKFGRSTAQTPLQPSSLVSRLDAERDDDGSDTDGSDTFQDTRSNYRENPCKSALFIMMPLVKGKLRNYIIDSVKNEASTLPDRLRICDGLFAGMEYMHNLAVIHGDFKPENVLLDNYGDEGVKEGKKPVPKIIDFGSSRGTWGYFDPSSGEPVSLQQDICSLGRVIAEIAYPKSTEGEFFMSIFAKKNQDDFCPKLIGAMGQTTARDIWALVKDMTAKGAGANRPDSKQVRARWTSILDSETRARIAAEEQKRGESTEGR